MYRVNVQVTAYGLQTVPDRGVIRSCDPLKFWGSNHITVTVEPKVVKFCTHVQSGPKIAQFLYALSLPNIIRFSKLFHSQNQEKMCNNTIS